MNKKILAFVLAFAIVISPFSSITAKAEEEYDNSKFEKPEYIDLLDEIIASENKYVLSGVQIAVYKDEELIKNSAYGYTNDYYNLYDSSGNVILDEIGVLPLDERNKVTTDTLFDLASNTKMYSTVYAMQKLASEGKISLDTKISEIFPEFLNFENENGWKDRIDLRMVLSHRAGFAPDPQYHNESYDEDDKIENGVNDLYSQDRDKTFDMIMRTPLNTEPDTKWAYSDVDMMLAGFIVEKISGLSLDEYVKTNIYYPLGLDRITFNPLRNGFSEDETSSSELHGNTRDGRITFNNVRTEIVTGQVHDEKAYYSMDGISGHAGLFANAQQLAYLEQAMIYGGSLDGVKLFSQDVIDSFTRRSELGTQADGGWRRKSEEGGAAVWYSKFAPAGTIGHTGWTGTNTLIDKENKLTVALLTNRVNSPVMGPGPNDFYSANSNVSSYGLVSELVYRGLGLGTDEIESANQLLIKLVEDEIPENIDDATPAKRNVLRSLIDVLDNRKNSDSELSEFFYSEKIVEIVNKLSEYEGKDMKFLVVTKDLEDALVRAKNYTRSDFTKESLSGLDRATRSARDLLEKQYYTQGEIDKAYQDVLDCINNLEFKSENKVIKEANKRIKRFENLKAEKYSRELYLELENTINEIEEVLNGNVIDCIRLYDLIIDFDYNLHN